eukprot:scaffold283914_cov15-Tisochrysis_lutea.AAC.1
MSNLGGLSVGLARGWRQSLMLLTERPGEHPIIHMLTHPSIAAPSHIRTHTHTHTHTHIRWHASKQAEHAEGKCFWLAHRHARAPLGADIGMRTHAVCTGWQAWWR